MYKIIYPKTTSEFDIHATLFNKLKELGYDVKGEVIDKQQPSTRTPKEHKKCMKYSVCRFDLVVFKEKEAVCIIEVKNNGKVPVGTRQNRKYTQYGVPVLFCTSFSEIESTVNKVSNIMNL